MPDVEQMNDGQKSTDNQYKVPTIVEMRTVNAAVLPVFKELGYEWVIYFTLEIIYIIFTKLGFKQFAIQTNLFCSSLKAKKFTIFYIMAQLAGTEEYINWISAEG